MWRGLIVLFFVCCVSNGTLGYVEEDVVSVESLRRDVREPLPFATEVEDLLGQGNDHSPKKRMKNESGKSDEGGYYKTYENDAEGEKGYLKAIYNKGNHGYKTLDTFHKRDGDKYAFEKHEAYGKARDHKKGGHHGYGGSASSSNSDHDGAGTIVDAHYTDSDDHLGEGDHSGYSGGGQSTGHGAGSSSYDHSGSDGGHGSYESHSSYSRNYGDEHGGDQGGHYY